MLSHSVFNPMSPQALAISNLMIFTMIVSGAIVLLVAAVLVHNIIRYRRRPGDGEPRQTYGVTSLEIAWTVSPFILLLVVFVVTVGAMIAASPGQIGLSAGAAQNPHRLTVIAHQWWWDVRYPSGAEAANEIHIPVGVRYVVALKSYDVIHDFWVPQCGPKMDNVPGQTDYLWLECDRVGVYNGQCTEFCGAGHAWMLLKVVVQPQAQFAAWEQLQARPAPPAAQLHPPAGYTASEAMKGAQLFQSFACQSCHQIDGLKANGTPANVDYAPNLTHVGGRSILADGAITNTPAHMESWLADPDAIKPGVHMPNFELDTTQLRDLTAYLESLR